MSVVGLKTDYTTPHRVVAFTSQVIPPFIIKGVASELSVENGILMRGSRVVIPASLPSEYP